MLNFHILTLFPELFPGPLGHSITGKALDKDLWGFETINIRDFATDKHQSVDDTPYGGGAGMVLRADVVGKATEQTPKNAKRIYLSPRGRPLTQDYVKTLAHDYCDIVLLCGRYEGVDQRVLDAYEFEEVSIGDYVLTGGEMAAHIVMDATIRLQPGVLGNEETAGSESFENDLLEYPHYTRPADWSGPDGTEYRVPDILKSGNHARIDDWRLEKAIEITKKNRPDLYKAWQKKQG